jgi:hypothetical protein
MNFDTIKNYNEIKKYSEQLLYNEDWSGSRDLINFLIGKIKELNLEKFDNFLFQKYKRIILKLKWICLDIYSEEEILELIKNYFSEVYYVHENYNIWEHVRMKLLQELDFDKRNNFKLQIRKALKENNQKLTSGDNIKSVKDWVNEYIKSVGEGIALKLQQLNFFQQNHNFQNLNSEDKDKVRKLLNFYERLKISSKSLLGIEEGVPVPYEESPNTHIRDGQIIAPERKDELTILIEQAQKARAAETPKTEQETNLAELKQMFSQYPEGSLERKVIEEEMEGLNH